MGEIARNHSYIIDLDKPLVKHSGVVFAEGDNGGDVFAFTLQRNGAALALYPSPEITGYFIRPDETTVILTGEGSGNSGTISLPLACYALSGRCTLTVKATYSGVTTTILILDGFVKRTTTNVEPGDGGSTSGSVVTVAGAVRYDIAQSLTDDQKAQARANIGVTSMGADISGIIDDSTMSLEKAWSSSKTAGQITALQELENADYEDLSGKIGEITQLSTTTKEDLVSAINEVNSKVGGDTGAAIDDTTTSASTTWSSSKITQAINDAAAGETLPTNSLRIECWGDSLTFGAGAAGDDWTYSGAYPAVLAGLLGVSYPDDVHNYGVGEENCETILARMGATPMLVTKQVNIGAEAGSVTTITLASATGAEVKPLRQIPSDTNISGKDKGVNPVTIKGIEGTLSYDSTLGYVFTRTSGGSSSTPILQPTEVVTAYKRMSHDNRVRVIWMGQNDIVDADMGSDMAQLGQYIIEACRAAIRGVDKYIILTAPVSTGATAAPYKPIHRAMVHAFGDHCINIVDYLINYGLNDAGITATSTDADDITAYKVPNSLRADNVHLNAEGYAIVAQQVYKRGQELGYW